MNAIQFQLLCLLLADEIPLAVRKVRILKTRCILVPLGIYAKMHASEQRHQHGCRDSACHNLGGAFGGEGKGIVGSPGTDGKFDWSLGNGKGDSLLSASANSNAHLKLVFARGSFEHNLPASLGPSHTE